MGNTSCEVKDTIPSEINDNKEKIEVKDNKKIKEKSPQKNNKSKTGFTSHKTSNKKEIKKNNKALKSISKPKQKRVYSKEKKRINFKKDIKNILPNSKKRNTISLENKIKPNFLNKSTKFNKKKTFTTNGKNGKNNKIEIKNKNKKINYNDISNNLSNDLIDDELIIDNNNDELEESFNLFGNDIYDKNKKEKKDLKEKINKTKEKIINIKKELKNSKIEENNSINSGSGGAKENNNNNKAQNNDKIEKNKINNSNNNSNGNSNNTKIETNKINNSFFKNNSNITNKNNEKNKNDKKIKEEKKTNNNIISTGKNHLNSGVEIIQISKIVTTALNNNNNVNTNTKKNINTIKSISKEKNKINKIYYSETDFGSNNNKKEYLTVNTAGNNNNEKIINKIKEIKFKIYRKSTPEKRKTYTSFGSKFAKIKKSETMDNKQIKNNIPSYRRANSKSYNIYSPCVNSCTFDKNKTKRNKKVKRLISLENTIHNSLLNSNIKNKNNILSTIYSFKKKRKNSTNNNSKENLSKFSVHHSYLNNSSIINISTNDINSINSKIIKSQRLLNIISKNVINKENNSNEIIEKINNGNYNNYNIENILSYNFRDAAEIDITPVDNIDSLIDKSLLKSHISNKIILNYNKIDNFEISQILYDGILYKIVENKNKGFKITERYFQIKKNCFRYYISIDKAKKDFENPLVQFDIRHIKEINIIDNKVFKQYKVNEKEIKFTLCIYLNQNDDFFVFVFNNEKLGNSIYNILNLLKNYYEDKKLNI